MDPGRERHCDKSHKRHVIMMLVALLDLSLINFVALLGWLFISFVALLGWVFISFVALLGLSH